MDKNIILCTLMFLSFIGFFTHCSAHELQAEGSIITTMHIDPNDEPIAKDSSVLEFSFVDREGTFNINNCDCVLQISKDNTLLVNTKIIDNADVTLNDLSFSYDYIFPDKGSYAISLSGTSGPEEDDKIDFDFNVNVNRELGEKITLYEQFLILIKGHGLHVLLFGGAILISLIVIITDKPDKKI